MSVDADIIADLNLPARETMIIDARAGGNAARSSNLRSKITAMVMVNASVPFTMGTIFLEHTNASSLRRADGFFSAGCSLSGAFSSAIVAWKRGAECGCAE